jgi:arsenite methyltransferase
VIDFDITGEGMAGALYWKDLFTLAEQTGFSTPRLASVSPVPIDREDFKKVLGNSRYFVFSSQI